MRAASRSSWTPCISATNSSRPASRPVSPAGAAGLAGRSGEGPLGMAGYGGPVCRIHPNITSCDRGDRPGSAPLICGVICGTDLQAAADRIGPDGGCGRVGGRRWGDRGLTVHSAAPVVQRDTPARSTRHAGVAGAFAYSLEQMLEPGHLLGHNEEPDRQQPWLSPLRAGAEVVGENAPRPLAGRSRDRTWCAARSLGATMVALSGRRSLLTPAATIRSASMSSPESVSSRMASVGSSTAIWRISFRFFSPPEKPELTARLMISGSHSTSLSFSSSESRKSIESTSSSPRAFRISLYAARRKYALVTPGISTGYWNARKTPAWARSSGSSSSRSCPVRDGAAGHLVRRDGRPAPAPACSCRSRWGP